METFTIAGKSYHLSKYSKDFLQKYLNRVERFIKKHDLDPDLLEDIKERLIEKLDTAQTHHEKKEIKEETIVSIVNSLGEPEEIFSDIIEDDVPKTETSKSHAEEEKSFWEFDPDEHGNSIIFGLCVNFGEKFNLNPWIFRILFLFGIFIYFLGPILYILSALIFLPRGDVKAEINRISKKFKKNSKKTNTQAEETSKTVQENDPVQSSPPEKPQKEKRSVFWPVIGSIFRGIGRFLLFILRIIFFGSLFLVLVGTTLAIILTGPLLFTDFSVHNQQLFAYVPALSKWGILVLGLSMLILTLWCFNGILKKKIVPTLLGIFALTGASFGFFTGMVGVYSVIGQYTEVYSDTTTFDLQIGSGTYQVVGIDRLTQGNNQTDFLNIEFQNTHVRFIPTDASTLTITVKAKVHAKSTAQAEDIFEHLSPVKIIRNRNQIEFHLEEDTLFTEPVPYSFLHYDIAIALPEGVLLDFEKEAWDVYFSEVYIPETRIPISLNCKFYPVAYNSEQERFECRPPEHILANTMLIEDYNEYLRENRAHQNFETLFLDYMQHETLLLLTAFEFDVPDQLQFINLEKVFDDQYELQVRFDKQVHTYQIQTEKHYNGVWPAQIEERK